MFPRPVPRHAVARRWCPINGARRAARRPGPARRRQSQAQCSPRLSADTALLQSPAATDHRHPTGTAAADIDAARPFAPPRCRTESPAGAVIASAPELADRAPAATDPRRQRGGPPWRRRSRCWILSTGRRAPSRGSQRCCAACSPDRRADEIRAALLRATGRLAALRRQGRAAWPESNTAGGTRAFRARSVPRPGAALVVSASRQSSCSATTAYSQALQRRRQHRAASQPGGSARSRASSSSAPAAQRIAPARLPAQRVHVRDGGAPRPKARSSTTFSCSCRRRRQPGAGADFDLPRSHARDVR